jgi:glycosyltransferase involved in cell wall biosynthesis
MKILFVSPYLPSPPRFGGQRRIDGLVRGLAHEHEVSMLSFNSSDAHAEASVAATEAYCKSVRTLPDLDPGSVAEKRKLQLRSLASLHSYEYLQVHARSDFQKLIDERLSSEQFDVVQVEFANMASYSYARRRQGTRLVLDEHNIEFDLQRRTAGASQGLSRRVYNSLNWRKLGREEKQAWRTFDGVVLTSDRDRELLTRESPSTRSAVVPNGVDVEQFVPSTEAVDPDRLLFFGANNYFPNHDGLLYFIDEILPKIVQRRPNVKLSIVGPGVQPDVLSRQGRHVEVVGFVDDLMPHLERAALVVVPLRIGGGTRLKIVEAMAKQKAIVSTRIGAEGIDLTHGRDVLLADTPEEFATEVCRALTDPELVVRLGLHARELAEQRYAWTAVVRQLTAFYDRLRP